MPPAYFIPLAIAELVMLVAAFMLRKKKSVGYGFTYAFFVYIRHHAVSDC